MKKLGFKGILGLILGAALSLAFVAQASAMTPTLSLTNTGYGTIQVTVYGDANASVILDYYSGGQLLGAGIIGTTNYNGTFTAQLNANAYNIPNGAQTLVVVNGQQSAPITWANSSSYIGGGSTGTLSLSQASLVLTAGQSSIVTSYNNTGSLYVSSNTNSSVATATSYSNQITVIGQNYGSTTMTICSSYGGCSSLYVTVSGSSLGGQTTPVLSQSSVSMTVGQSQTVTISNGYYYNGASQYYISNNGSNIVNATISGNTVNLYGQVIGTTTISVCSNNTGSSSTYYGGTGCASLYVTVNANNYYYPPTQYYPQVTTPYYPPTNYYAPITVSNSNVQVSVGNVGTVILNANNNYSYPYNNGGYNNNFYITNGNNGIATATISGNTLTIYGNAAGFTTVNVCQSSGGSQCATVNVTVIAPTYYNYTNYNGQYQYVQSNNGQYYYSNQKNCWLHR